MLPVITVICAITRYSMVDRWLEDLASTDLDPSKTNLIFLIDTDIDGPLIYGRIMYEMNHTAFRKFFIHRNYEHRVNEVNLPIRRQRIAEVMNLLKDYIVNTDCDYVLCIEDDTIFTNLSVQRLYEKAKLPEVGLVTTYEAGRWHNKIIGIWEFNNITEPTECWTVLPDQGFQAIDASGLYCLLIKRELIEGHTFNTELWQPWGCDVNFGLSLRQLGYTNIVDWSQPTGHNTEDGIITPNDNLYVEHFWKTGPNEWVRRKQDA